MKNSLETVPIFVLRGHVSDITSLEFYTNALLLSGHMNGSVFIWNLDTRRPILKFMAHKQNVISLRLFNSGILLTQGREGTICLWKLLTLKECNGWSPMFENNENEIIQEEEDVKKNVKKLAEVVTGALGFCPIDILEDNNSNLKLIVTPTSNESELKFILIVNNRFELLSSFDISQIQIISNPNQPNQIPIQYSSSNFAHSFNRDINRDNKQPNDTTLKTGLVMYTRIFKFKFKFTPYNLENSQDTILVCGFESGHVLFWSMSLNLNLKSNTSLDIQPLCSFIWDKTPVMSIDLDPTRNRGVIGFAGYKIFFFKFDISNQSVSILNIAELKTPGVAHVNYRSDGKIIAVGCWDHSVRLYSGTTFRPLAILKYHEKTVSNVCFPRYYKISSHFVKYSIMNVLDVKHGLMATVSSDSGIAVYIIYPLQESTELTISNKI